MKINHEVIINKSREDVWRVFDNPENMKGWQPTLKKYEHQSGQPRQVGAVSKLTYEEKGREIVMTEAITGRDVPGELSGRYTMRQATNKVSNKFVSLDESKTEWVMICRFSFKGFSWKLISPLMRGAMRKRIEKSMNLFKQLAENQ
jgi:carbon monoxide dehydrogenase subunit G